MMKRIVMNYTSFSGAGGKKEVTKGGASQEISSKGDNSGGSMNEFWKGKESITKEDAFVTVSNTEVAAFVTSSVQSVFPNRMSLLD